MFLGKRSILIVDDDRLLVEMLKTRLEYEGFKILSAYEGVTALETARKKKPDLILLDLWMPVSTGVTVLEKLRAEKETREIPVVVVTALEKRSSEQLVKKMGVEEIIQKPYDMKDLMTKVRHYLPSRKPSDQEAE